MKENTFYGDTKKKTRKYSMKFHLKRIREENNISIERLSKMAKVAKSSIVRIEDGSANPTMKTMFKLAKTLNVDVWELIESD